MVRRLALAVTAAAALLLAACDTAGLDDFREEVVVSALLVAGDPPPPVYLSRTIPISQPLDSLTYLVSGAEVTVSLLAAGGAVEAAYPYRELEPGRYGPIDLDATVQAGRRYRLEARVPGFERPTTAEVTVPDSFAVVRPPPDSVAYQVGDAPTFDVTPSAFAGRQTVYVLTFEALDPVPENLTPFAAELVEERDVSLETLVKAASPLLNAETFLVNADGSIRIELPWFSFNFYGPTRVSLSTPDDALVRFLEFQAIQTVPTTISPGEIPEVPTNVENGVGIFGAVAEVAVELVVVRP